MIDVLVALLGLGLGYFIGYNQAKIKSQLDRLKVDEPAPAVTRDDPRLINENYQGKSEVGVASPKSPQLLEFEAEQELRNRVDSYSVRPQ